MSGTYRTWQDLDDEEQPAVAPSAPAGHAGPTERVGELRDVAPPELLELLQKKEELESQLRRLTTGEPAPEDERRAKCFPVKVHTKETRIEERRLKRRDEQLALAAQRAMEIACLEKKREELDQQRRQRSLEQAVLAQAEAQREDQARRLALAHAILSQRHAAMQEEAREHLRQSMARAANAEAIVKARRERELAEEARLAEERAALLERWAANLQESLAHARREREQQQSVLEQHEEVRRMVITKRGVDARVARVSAQETETAKRDAERRLRNERSGRRRAEQRSFDARRDRDSTVRQSNRVHSARGP